MVSRALLVTSPVVVIDPETRAAFRQAGRRFSSAKYRWLRRFHRLKWLALHAALVGAVLASLAVVPLLGLILIGGLAWRWKTQRADDSEYGTAHLATLRDLVMRGYLYGCSGVVVGRVLDGSGNAAKLATDVLKHYPTHADDLAVRVARGLGAGSARRAPILLPEHDLVHLSVYGRSGAGKSTSHVIPNLLLDLGSAVVTDVKSELAEATARHRAEMFGHDIVCIAPFGGVPDGFEAHAFNPLSVVNLQSPHLVSDAIHFAKALIRPDKQDHNPFFIKSTIIVLDAVLSFLFCHAAPSDCTLQKLREITVDPQKLQEVAEWMLQSNFAGGYLRSKGRQLQALTGKTLMDVLATLNTQLFWIDSLAVEHATHWTTFDFRKLLEGRMSVFLMLPVDRAEEYSPLLRCWITAIAHAIFSAGVGRSQGVRFYFDEASLLGPDMPVLERMLTKGRAFGMKSCWCWQSVHQVQEVFPEHQAQVFREQMSVEQFLEISHYETAREVSQWIGQTTIRVANESQTSGWSQSDTYSVQQPSSSHGWSGSTTSGYQKAGRALLQAEELLQLPSDVTVVLKPQCPPILARKIKSYLAADRVELLAIPFGKSPELAFARSQRRFVATAGLLAVGAFCLTHPAETRRFQNNVAAIWNQQHAPHLVEPKPDKPAKAKKKPRQPRRRPMHYYNY